ncbi:MAG: hypothetical protein PUD59_06110, partial [bacterium]|nr:hypothetical protein [bacterium]
MQEDGQTVASLSGGAVIPYAREYDLRVTDDGVLERLTEETHGQMVPTADALLSFPEAAAQTRHDLTAWLMMAALLTLLLDIAQRRLSWEKALPKHSDEPKSPRTRAAKRPRVKPKAKTEADRTQTSQQLWENMQNRKRL